MDMRHRYIKPSDYREIIAADGRLIRVFTMSEHPVWMTCIYDEERDIAWRMPHLDYEHAYGDFVTFCKLLEYREPNEMPKTEHRNQHEGLEGRAFIFWVLLAICIYWILQN